MVDTQREIVADCYRRANLAYRPFYDDTRPWAELTPALAQKILEAAELAAGVDRSWRRESGFVGCLFGARGCPPWGPRDCEGHNPTANQSVTQQRASQ